MLKKKKEKIIQTCHDLVENGHSQNTGVAGNVSERDPAENLIAITPSHTRYDTMETEDIIIVDKDGNVVQGKDNLKPSSELLSHLAIYQNFDEVHSVIHSHPKYSTALGLLLDKIPPVSEAHGYFFGYEIPIIEHVKTRTEKMAKTIVNNLKKRPGLVIQNHGIVTVGENVDEALIRALEMENNSMLYYLAKLLGMGEPKCLDKQSIKELQEKYQSNR
ncbi:hypothetical protein AKJ57_05325 [candidate division MSBL1 archaeon SCGC-AAA259A05]|uniref:Class II aldolase/adducin N-terminal domain-containing protein n=1 Tax=candidate division MSBL1 archaeon SCGC-AAA259A05 TaxID=1698259 RepID=A0A133U5H1_9EURY|nr:hypothetical protein AKJ57_05325 [candidate division MSBL1 archaeon SCGC-AAA259A05]